MVQNYGITNPNFRSNFRKKKLVDYMKKRTSKAILKHTNEALTNKKKMHL